MVAAEDNLANEQRRAKQMVRWQVPYQIVRRASATEFDVLLYDDTADRAAPVHWIRMKRFAGADFAMTAELVEGAQHDRHKFYVEDIVGWRESDDGSIELEVKWRGFHPTWEPIDRLYEDVRNQVVKFLRANSQHDPFRLALQRLTSTTQTTPVSRVRR